MHYSDESPPPVESVLLSSVVEPQDVDSQGTSTVHIEVSHPLQIYHRRQTTPMPLMTKPASFADANPPTSLLDLPIVLRKGTRSSTAHLISNFVSYESLHPHFGSFALSLSSESIPRNHQEALSLPHWKVAMDEKITALTTCGT